jgi:hypothetical protein
MADERKSMSQDEIDSLLAGLTGEAPTSPPATSAKIPSKPDAAAATVLSGGDPALAQNALDALLAAAAEPPPTKSVSKPAPPSAKLAKPAQADLALDQNAIDALLAAAAEPPPTKPASKPAAKPVSKPASGPLDQDSIDAMIADMVGSTTPPSRPGTEVHQPAPMAPITEGPPLTRRTPPASPAVKAAPSGPLDQDAIDALVAATGGDAVVQRPPTTARAADASDADQPLTRNQSGTMPPTTDIDRLLASVETSAQERAKATVGAMPGVAPGVPLDQEDIDKLLAELGASAAPTPSPAKPVTQTSAKTDAFSQADAFAMPSTGMTSRPGSSSRSSSKTKPALALSSDDLDALVNKHTAGDTETGVDMIDQGDIDALVKQLAAATEEPEPDKISDALAKHGETIDKLLEKSVDPHLTQDAVEMPKTPTSGASSITQMRPATVVAQLPPIDMRGTRWLLAAAVILLAACAAILTMVVGAVGGLSRELRQERIAQLTPSDDFHDDFSAARAKLASPDEAETAKGVLFLERLQKRYPEHEADIALVLARYHRSIGAIARAVHDYALVVESTTRPLDDPRIYLEYAECLFQQQDEVGATKQVYVVLANEALYRAERDHRGVLRPNEERERNRRAVQDAYLALGRMLAASVRDGGRVAANGHGAPSASEAGAAHGDEAAESGHKASGHDAHGSTEHQSGGHDAHEAIEGAGTMESPAVHRDGHETTHEIAAPPAAHEAPTEHAAPAEGAAPAHGASGGH